MNDIKGKTVSGLKWSTISLIGRQGTQLLTGIILARLLLPSDFGVLGMAMIVIGFIGVFKDLGTSSAVVQQKCLTDDLLSSLFWLNFSFGSIITLAVFFISPLIGFFFNNESVIPVLRILSMSFVITSLSVVQKSLYERDLHFQPLAIIELISSLVGSVLGIYLAVNGCGVWSLVFQTLLSSIAATFLLLIFCPWKTSIRFNLHELSKVKKFSLNLIGFNTVNYFCRNADNILIGRFFGTQQLGYYSIGYNILMVSTYLITGIVSRVIFPVYSLMQDNNERLVTTYLTISKLIGTTTFPIMMGEFILASPLILTCYGEKWAPVIPLVMIFAPIGMLQSIGATIGSIYQAKGRTDLMFGWGVFSSVVVVLGFMVGLRWGIIGIAISYLLTTCILIVPSFVIPFRLIDLQFFKFLNSIKLPFFNSLIMLLALAATRSLFSSNLANYLDLIISTIFGAIVYLSASWITNKQQIVDLYVLIFPRKIRHE